MQRGVLIVLFLSLSLVLMTGRAWSSETSKPVAAASEQGVQKTRWSSLFLWLSSPRDWFHSRKAGGQDANQGLITGARHDQAAAAETQRHLLALGRSGRDENDSVKTFLFVRPKPVPSDIGAPAVPQDQTSQSAKNGCAAFGNDGNASNDTKLSTLTDLSLGICLRF